MKRKMKKISAGDCSNENGTTEKEVDAEIQVAEETSIDNSCENLEAEAKSKLIKFLAQEMLRNV